MMKYITLFIILLVTGCASTAVMDKNEEWLFLKRMDYKSLPDPDNFKICYGSGCQQKANIKLSDKQWKQIGRYFKTGRTANQERLAIAKAVGQFERFAGEQSPTHLDRAENVFETQYGGQLDCVDESINATLYLLLMREKNLLKHHTVMFPTGRGHFFGGWPHNAALIQDNKTSQNYIVDGWFLNNGARAQLVPLELWQSGWSVKKENEHGTHTINEKGQWSPLPDWQKN